MKKWMLAALLVSAGMAHAQNPAPLDPPLTAQEQKTLEQLRVEYRKAGHAALTQEQEVQLIVQMRARLIQMMGNAMAAQQMGEHMSRMEPADAQRMAAGLVGARLQQGAAPAPAAMPAAVPASMDAAAMAAAVAERGKSALPTRFEARKEGFLYNGKAFVDTGGEIVQYGADSATGDVAYLVEVAPGLMQLKYNNVNAQLPPLLLGQVTEQGSVYSLQTVSGETSAGQGIVPTSRGAMVLRSGSMVSFDAASGIRAVALPEGFGVAQLQQGDVSGTGFILLERDEEVTAESDSPLQRLRMAKERMSSLFNDKSHDYVLFSPATGQAVPLNMSAEGKRTSVFGDCKPMNSFLNKCDTMERRVSLWNQDGTRNERHYFWTAYWFNTSVGPIAVARENTSKEISVYQLATGRKVTAFRRTLGIGVWSVQQAANGSIQIRASWPFIKQPVIEDATSVFDEGFNTIQ